MDGTYHYNSSIYSSGTSFTGQNRIVILKEYGELRHDLGALTASGKTISLDNGTIQYTTFSGYTGAATISITGFAGTGTNQVQSLFLVIGNTGSYSPPTITWSGVIWSDETGSPAFGASKSLYVLPLSSIGSPPLGASAWIGGSQLTYKF